jgi:hypothetical protein
VEVSLGDVDRERWQTYEVESTSFMVAVVGVFASRGSQYIARFLFKRLRIALEVFYFLFNLESKEVCQRLIT